MSDERCRLSLVGAAGRMGQRVMRLLNEAGDLELAQALEDGTEVDAAWPPTDVLIDFSAPPACAHWLPRAVDEGVAYLLASTGLGDDDLQLANDAAKKIPVLVAANLSLGVNVLLEAIELCAQKTATFRPRDF